MKIGHKDVQKVAFLARLHIPEDKCPQVATELTGILNWIEQLRSVKTDGVAPMISPVALHTSQRLRDDVVTDGYIQAKVLSNAPAAEQGFFVVPKVFE